MFDHGEEKQNPKINKRLTSCAINSHAFRALPATLSGTLK